MGKARVLAMIFQSHVLYPHLTVEQNILFELAANKRGTAKVIKRSS